MNPLPNELLQTIVEYMTPMHYRLRDGIDESRLFYNYLYEIPIYTTISNTPLPRLSRHENGQLYMINHVETQINFTDFIITGTFKVCCDDEWIDCNPDDAAVSYMLEHTEKIDLLRFCANSHTLVVQYILEHPHLIKWKLFSSNSNSVAIDYVLAHPHNISWTYFCQNTNQKAIDYLIQHPEHIEWITFSQNLSIYQMAIDIVAQIEWYSYLST